MVDEISRVDLYEYPRNVAGDTIEIRDLVFEAQITAIPVGKNLQLDSQAFTAQDVGKIIEIKHPTDYTKYELKTLVSVNGTQITMDAVFTYVYPIGSLVYWCVGDRDIFDSLITDRTEVSVIFVEKDFRDKD